MEFLFEHRIRRLEIWNRIMILLLLGFVILFTKQGCVNDRSGDIIRCQKLEVVDKNGNLLAMVGVDPDGSRGLFVYDEQQRMRVLTIHDSTQSAFYALDEAGAIRVGLAQYAHGGGGLALHGSESKGGTVIYYKNGGSIRFYDRKGNTTLRIPEKE